MGSGLKVEIGLAGFPTKEQMIKLSPALPAMRAAELPWLSVGDRASQQSVFRLLSECGLALEFADCLLSNSCSDMEQTACDLAPRVKTIGPLLAGSRLRQFDGNFWQEDTECLRWLDRQPPNSVIYVAFGSFTTFDKRQFQELALGLELCNRSFLWVVRPDLIDASSAADYFPDGFRARIGDRGQIVGWSPQQKVLAHPSIACFVTHCGWNSTTEGLSNGVPFLCWPYFSDQKLNLAYICHVWKVGLALEKDGDGIVSREEMKGKIQALVGDEGLKARSLELKGIVRKSVVEGGSSFKNFNDFVEAMKQ
ncbi:hypothetical protein ACLOJK_038522 [Asimina triloba]